MIIYSEWHGILLTRGKWGKGRRQMHHSFLLERVESEFLEITSFMGFFKLSLSVMFFASMKSFPGFASSFFWSCFFESSFSPLSVSETVIPVFCFGEVGGRNDQVAKWSYAIDTISWAIAYLKSLGMHFEVWHYQFLAPKAIECDQPSHLIQNDAYLCCFGRR